MLLSLDLSECLRFRFAFANLGNPWVGHKKHDVAVLSESGCCSQVLLFQQLRVVLCSCGPSGSLVVEENSFVRFVLAQSLTQKPLTFSASLFCDLFIMVKIRHSWPTCVVSVFGGSRLTASNGRPRIGRVAQSKSKFVVLSLCFSKNAVRILSPFFGHDFVANNWALSKFEAAARRWARF